MATRYLHLIRHGQHEQEDERSRERLTPLGVEQAQLTAQRLRSLPITAIHCSSLPRAVETAEIIAQTFPDVPLHKTRYLRECVPCIPQNISKYTLKIPAEKLAAYREQAESAFDRYFKRTRGADKHEVLVCHGNIIRYFVCRVLGAPPKAWLNMDSDNCGISLVKIVPDGGMWLISYNDVGHLPHSLAVY
jgi:serine/threonine-protein phosphatase PGAM5